jgi:hypothetical protein
VTPSAIAALVEKLNRCVADRKSQGQAMKESGITAVELDGVTKGARGTELVTRFADRLALAIVTAKRERRRQAQEKADT